MIPSIDDRLASITRALTDVVLPSLSPEAGLASEQVQLAIAHLQILRAQVDAAPAYEAEELADAVQLGETLSGLVSGAAERLDTTLSHAPQAIGGPAIREARIAINAAIADLVRRCGGEPAIRNAVIAAELRRAAKDRAWLKPFGFDPGEV